MEGEQKVDTVAWNLSDTLQEVDGIFPFLVEQHHSTHYQGVQSYKMPTEGEPKRVVNEHNDHKTLFNSFLHYNQNFFF